MKKTCPYCGEEILISARKCRFCNEWLLDDNHARKTMSKISVKGKVFMVITIFLLLSIFWNIGRNLSGLKNYSFNQNGLEMALERQNKLNNIGDEASGRELYRNFLLPKDRTMTEDEYVNGFLKYSKNHPYSKSIRHGIKIIHSIAYVDRTLLTCNDKDCTSISGQSRSYRKYFYENGNWYFQRDDVLCPRDSGYDMEPEFSRALSLITQRLFANKLEEANLYQEITRCVDIRYASTNEEVNGAEGMFKFIPNQSMEMNLRHLLNKIAF